MVIIIVCHPPEGVLTQPQRGLLRKIHGSHTINIHKRMFESYEDFLSFFLKKNTIFYLDSRNETWVRRLKNAGYEIGVIEPTKITYPGGVKTEIFSITFHYKKGRSRKESLGRVAKRNPCMFRKKNKK